MRVHSNVLTGLSLAIYLARLEVLWEEPSYVRAKPRSAATLDRSYPGQLFLLEWSPIDVEIHKPIPSSTTGVIVVSVDLYGLVSNSCKCLVICNKDVSTSNSNPGLVMTLGVNFWNIVFPKSGPDSLGIRARLTIG